MSIVTDVRNVIGEASAVFWTDTHVYDAINEAQLDLYSRTKWALTTATLALNSEDDIVAIPPTIFIPQYIEYQSKRYYPTSHARLEQYDRRWRGKALGTPKWFVLWDAEHLRVWPRPSQEFDMTLWGVGWPTEVDSSNTDIDGDRTYKRAVVLEAAALLLDFTRPDLAEIIRAEGAEVLSTFKRTLRNQQSHNIRRLRPGTLLNRAQGGGIDVGSRLS